jgi:hypothetical protein
MSAISKLDQTGEREKRKVSDVVRGGRVRKGCTEQEEGERVKR